MKIFITTIAFIALATAAKAEPLLSNMPEDITKDVLNGIYDVGADSFFADRDGTVTELTFNEEKKSFEVVITFSAIDDSGRLVSGCEVPNVNGPASIMDKFGLRDDIANHLIFCFANPY